jgi:hypothetical protein
MNRLDVTRRVLWGVTLAGLAAFFVAIVNGPLVHLGVAGWGLFMIGLVLLVPVNALLNDRSGRTRRKVRRVHDDRFRTVGRVLLVVGVIGYVVSALAGLSGEIMLGMWGASMLGLTILIVLNWRRLSGY